MKNKVLFIIPYFGKFKNYFQLFLNSCDFNKDFNWLIITDDRSIYTYPKNVRVVYKSFNDLKMEFQSKFPFKLGLEKPYKLCDFKPAYGYLFNEYLSGYDFWGYCDIDLIFGNLREFINDNVLNTYDKIGVLGHLTLIRNKKETNEAFMLPLNNKSRYIDVFRSNTNYSFDEEFKESINSTFEEYNFKIFDQINEANIYTKSSNFKIAKLVDKPNKYNIESKTRSFFLFDNGKLNRFFAKNGKMYSESYSYLHMQSRKMKTNVSQTSSLFKIIPNSFDPVERYPITTIRDFNCIKLKHFNLHYFTLRTMNLVDKIRNRINKGRY